MLGFQFERRMQRACNIRRLHDYQNIYNYINWLDNKQIKTNPYIVNSIT